MSYSESNPAFEAILLCGGKGTRLQELTGDHIPKSLFQVNGLELIRYSMDSIGSPALAKTIFAVDHLADQMEQWVATNYDLDSPYVLSQQDTPGITGAVKSALDQTTKNQIAVCNTDEIRSGFVVDELLEAHQRMGAGATMLAANCDNLYRHRALTLQGDIVIDSTLKGTEYVANPLTIGSVNSGFIVFERAVLEEADLEEPADWSNIIDPLIRTKNMAAFIVDTMDYFNVGTCEEYIEAERFTVSAE